MFNRQTVIIALAAVSTVAFAGGAAHALTIENYSGGSAGNGQGWVDLNYTDPNKKPSRDGEKRTLDNGTRFQFGPSDSANRRFDPNSYFSPNYLMGK